MAEDEQGERTEPASPRKREESRKKGMLAQSHDLAQALVLMAGLLALWAWGPHLLVALSQMMRNAIGNLHTGNDLMAWLVNYAPYYLWPVASLMLLWLGCMALSAAGAGLLQAGVQMNFEMLEPKWERLDPMQGIKRLFSASSLVNALMGVLKLSVIGWVAYGAVRQIVISAHQFWGYAPDELLTEVLRLGSSLGWTIAVPLLCLGVIDYGFKRWKFERDIRMSKQEVREENKQQEGDPQIKGRIRQIMRQRALQRMMQEVPKATVVITNPTHVAIALRYEPGVTHAPIVVAKGEHRIAERIKELARVHDIPVYERPPLARAMLRAIPLGKPISIEFYRAVAEVLAVLHRQNNAPTQRVASAGRSA